MRTECEGFVSKKRRMKRFIFTPEDVARRRASRYISTVNYLATGERMINPLVISMLLHVPATLRGHSSLVSGYKQFKPFESVDSMAIVTYLLFTETVFDEGGAVGAMKNQ
jgi:hypothetical protein